MLPLTIYQRHKSNVVWREISYADHIYCLLHVTCPPTLLLFLFNAICCRLAVLTALAILWWRSRRGWSGYHWLKVAVLCFPQGWSGLGWPGEKDVVFWLCHTQPASACSVLFCQQTHCCRWRAVECQYFLMVLEEVNTAGLSRFYERECGAWTGVMEGTCNSSPSISAAICAFCCPDRRSEKIWKGDPTK